MNLITFEVPRIEVHAIRTPDTLVSVLKARLDGLPAPDASVRYTGLPQLRRDDFPTAHFCTSQCCCEGRYSTFPPIR